MADRIRAGAFARSVGLGPTAEEEAGEGEGGAPDQAAAAAAHPLAPAKQYAANIGSVVRALTRSRAAGRLLHEPEWAAYREAVASGRCAVASSGGTCVPHRRCRPWCCAAFRMSKVLCSTCLGGGRRGCKGNEQLRVAPSCMYSLRCMLFWGGLCLCLVCMAP
jgi:hypothetical protein